MAFTVFDSPPAEVTSGTITNYGPGTVFYRDEQPVSAASSDGSLSVGASVTLAGAQFLVAAAGTRATVGFEARPPVTEGEPVEESVTFDTLAPSLQAILVIGRVHDGANYPERIDGVAFNHWVGPSEPTDFEDGDVWTPTV